MKKNNLKLALDIFMILALPLLMASGIILSTFVFSFVNFDSAYMESRLIHLCASYWGFLLMSFHAGLHVPVARFLDSAWNDCKNKLKAAIVILVRL